MDKHLHFRNKTALVPKIPKTVLGIFRDGDERASAASRRKYGDCPLFQD
jgi:hypothetical protein